MLGGRENCFEFRVHIININSKFIALALYTKTVSRKSGAFKSRMLRIIMISQTPLNRLLKGTKLPHELRVAEIWK